MHKPTIPKVICYVTKGGKLLVFRHTDYSFEEVGIQVPAGTMKPGETHEIHKFVWCPTPPPTAKC